MLRVCCPVCGRKLRAPDDLAGRRVCCPAARRPGARAGCCRRWRTGAACWGCRAAGGAAERVNGRGVALVWGKGPHPRRATYLLCCGQLCNYL
jgi:hypothetical protein